MARKTITLEQLDRLSVEESSGQLYWDGNEVVTVMSLPWWVQWAALAAAAGSLLSGVAAIVTLLK